MQPRRAPVEVSPEAQENYLLAKQLAAGEKFADALHLLERAVALSPRFVEAHRLYQDTCIKQGEAEGVLSEYGARAVNSPRDPVWQYLYARLQLSPREQERRLRKVISLDDSFSWGYYGLGVIRSQQRRYDSAARYLTRAVERPAQAGNEILLALGRVRLLQGKYDEARTLCAEASQREPTDPGPHALIARIVEWEGEGIGAERSLEACAKALETGACSEWILRYHQRLLERYGNKGAFEGSVILYRTLTAQAPDLPLPWRNLGYALLRLGRYDEAEACLLRARNLGSSPADYADDLRMAYVAMGEYVRAFEISREKVPDDILESEGNAFRKRFANVRELSRRAQHNPEDESIRLALAGAYRRVGWIYEARDVYEKLSATSSAAQQSLEALEKHARFCSDLRDFIERGYIRFTIRRKSTSLRGAIRHIYEIAEDVLGLEFERDGIKSYPFIAQTFLSAEEPTHGLLRYLWDHGQFLALWRLTSGPVEGVLGNIASIEPNRKIAIGGKEIAHSRYIITGTHIEGYDNFIGDGRVAGMATDEGYYVNMDEIWRDAASVMKWYGVWHEKTSASAAEHCALLERDRRSTYRISSISQYLCCEFISRHRQMDEYFRSVLDVVDVHEVGHVVDARAHFPVERHLFGNMIFLIECGFSSFQMMARLERNAEVAALAYSRAPVLALASTTSMLSPGAGHFSHGVGYREIINRYVQTILRDPGTYGSLPKEAPVLDALKLLNDRQISELARELGRTW